MEAHEQAVKAIEARVRDFHARQKPYRIFHGSTNSTRPSQRQPETSIDTSKLRNVIEVDRATRTAIVEPNLPMDGLVQATLKEGLIPLVVMEFPGITAGGAFSGTSGESSSFRHGFFDNTVNWIEIVLARGETVRASRTELPEVFWGAASSFGTLGVVTLLQIQLCDAASHVRLTYHPFADMDRAMDMMRTATADKTIDYLDGIVYSRDEIVVCAGSLVNELPSGAVSQGFTGRRDPWFYLSVQQQTKAAAKAAAKAGPDPITVYIPIVDYLFRYDRGAFWVGRYAFKYFLTPFNRITRFLADRFMHTRVMYHALHKSGQAEIYIIQDVAIPYDRATDFHLWLDDHLSIYPIWLCPLRQRRDAPDSQHGLYCHLGDPATSEFMMNFGVWGPGSTNRKQFLSQNRQLEQQVDALGGRKWLYAHAYYTEEEFWSIYDRADYDTLRQKYGAQYLPSVYDKVKVDLFDEQKPRSPKARLFGIWPVSGVYGVYKAWRGGDYLLQRKSTAMLESIKG